MANAYVIGVTGAIATGKSAVMAILDEFGAACIDADLVYRDLIRPGLPLWERLRRRFGDGIVGDDGQIDRKALGRIVFGDPAKLMLLDDLTHPAVAEHIRQTMAETPATIVAIEAVKLIESGMSALCDEVWLVVSDRETQLARLVERNGLSLDEAERRVDAQPAESERRRVATHVLDNSSTLDELRTAVTARWHDLPIASVADTPSPILPK